MKTKAQVVNDFEDYYNSEDCSLNAIFVTKEVIENIYLRGYKDGFGSAVDTVKTK